MGETEVTNTYEKKVKQEQWWQKEGNEEEKEANRIEKKGSTNFF